ncbi:MAG: permease [Chloroflexota bacterium]
MRQTEIPKPSPIITIAVIVIAVSSLTRLILASDGNAAGLLQIFATRFLGIFIEAAPFLLMGSVVSGLIEAYITPEDLTRWMPRNAFGSTLAGTFMGFVFPVCECGVVPVVRRLYNKGLPMGVGVAFLLAAPVMNPIVFASTYIAFGWGTILIGRFVLTALIALAIGLVFTLTARPMEVLKPTTLAPIMGGSQHNLEPRRSVWSGLMNAASVATDEVFEMGRYLIIGCLLAATLQTTLSQEALLALGQGPVFSVLVMNVFAFVLSVCSTVDAFLALAFAGTFTTGAILSFLTFGPMVDIKSMLMFTGVFQPRVVAYLVALPLLMSTAAAVWLNLNIVF